jgi:zinc transport system permease protein
MLEYEFMQRALVAAVLTGAVCGVLGFFVVLRRLAFVGVGISHSALGGVAIGLALGFDPLVSAALFSTAVALGIAQTSQRARLSEDAVIGVFFSAAMALGVVLFSLEGSAQQDLFGFLFGNVLAVSAPELLALAAGSLATLLVLAFFFRDLLFVAFDEESARAYGHRVGGLHALLLVLIAATVVLGVRLVGVLLVQALLVIPAATAALWARNYRSQIAVSAGLGVTCGVSGLALSYTLDWPPGATIVLLASLFFLASLPLRRNN